MRLQVLFLLKLTLLMFLLFKLAVLKLVEFLYISNNCLIATFATMPRMQYYKGIETGVFTKYVIKA